MKHEHTAPSPALPHLRCASGEHIWQATLTVGQLVCLRCGLLACCPLCQPLLPTPELVLVHCARHRLDVVRARQRQQRGEEQQPC